MKKEQETKIMRSLYIIIFILLINTICHFGVLAKMNTPISSDSNSTSKENSNSSYDISMFTSLNPSEITKKIKSGEEFVLFIGQANCTYCQKMLPTLQQAQKNYKYTTIYLNIAANNITNTAEYKEMANLLDVQKTVNGETKAFGKFEFTPMIAVIRDGKMIDGMIGYNTYENFAKFLEDSGIKK